MSRIAMQVVISAPVDEVFEFVADYRNALHYMDHFQSFRPLNGRSRGLGAKVKASGRLHGVPVSADLEIVGFEKNRRLVSVSRHGIHSVSEWSFEPAGSGTRVTFVGDYQLPRLPLGQRMLQKMLDDGIKAGVRRTLENLKRVMESPRAGGTGTGHQ